LENATSPTSTIEDKPTYPVILSDRKEPKDLGSSPTFAPRSFGYGPSSGLSLRMTIHLCEMPRV